MSKNKKEEITSDLEEFEEDENEEKTKLNSVETKLLLSKKLIANIRETLNQLELVLASDAESVDIEQLLTKIQTADGELIGFQSLDKIVEGVFDGQNMVGSDGRQYIVPQNYASKSKLVEGDILKLTIQSNGSFLFKQIGPIERERIVGTLLRDENTQIWKVVAEGKKYSVLPASVSYFKGQAGDDAVILIPQAAPSRWAAVENIIKKEE
ncbi:MAG: hypothetical protein AAB386_01260 [Patescibacteria group bacterium]